MLSEEMLIARAGNFTASENHRLMAGWDIPEPDKSFKGFKEVYAVIKPLYEAGDRKFLVGDLAGKFKFKLTGELIQKTLTVIKAEAPPTGLVTYAEEKAMELLFDIDPILNFNTIHTQNGEERELECMIKLSEVVGREFLHTGDDQIHIHSNEVGCTPDGVLFDDIDLVETGAEVKCKSPLVHAKNLLIDTNQDLMEAAFDHFVQVQTAMLVTGADHWYFANYNPYAKRKDMQFKHIVVERDESFIKILAKRIDLAKAIKADFLAKFEPKKIKEAA
jgi:hypothetical protein